MSEECYELSILSGGQWKIPVIVLILLAELSIQLNCTRNDRAGNKIAFRLKIDSHWWIRWRGRSYEPKQVILKKEIRNVKPGNNREIG